MPQIVSRAVCRKPVGLRAWLGLNPQPQQIIICKFPQDWHLITNSLPVLILIAGWMKHPTS